MKSSNELPSKDNNSVYDVVIVGAGVVGAALARRFTLEGAKVLVLEKHSDILAGASKGNSAILHTGFDAPPGSLEQSCIAAGNLEYREIYRDLGLALQEVGAMVVAWSQLEQEKLNSIQDQAIANGVDNIRLLTRVQLRKKQPELASTALAAIEIPDEAIVDPWTTAFAYLLQAIDNGASLKRYTELTGGEFDGKEWHLQTSQGVVRSRLVMNSTGLYGDCIDRLLLGSANFEISPRKGQFLVFDKSASALINATILPVPNEVTKGIVVCKTVFGNLLVGPTAETQKSRDDASVSGEILNSLYQTALSIIPQLANHAVVANYAGIRPATEFKDYCIQPFADKNYISVAGIRSTGLSSALGIASYVYELYSDMNYVHDKLPEIQTPYINPIAEGLERDWSKAGNGGIVCFCELVTRREIEQALSGPLGAKSLAALKRRTRATMGRCQGFYCTASICEMTDDIFTESVSIDNSGN